MVQQNYDNNFIAFYIRCDLILIYQYGVGEQVVIIIVAFIFPPRQCATAVKIINNSRSWCS
jgi:hypothetical protein